MGIHHFKQANFYLCLVIEGLLVFNNLDSHVFFVNSVESPRHLSE